MNARVKWLLAAAAVAAVVILAGPAVQPVLQRSLGAVGALGWWGPVVFAVVYAVATVLLVPGSVLTLGAGALFGLGRGFATVLAGATLGATLAFLVGRHLAREKVAAALRGKAWFGAVDEAVAREGWRVVLLTRLSPVFPFTLLNYAFGLTRVPLRSYVLASALGMIPGTLLYVYLGTLARAAAGPRERSAFEWALYAAGLVATLLVVGLVTRRARALLRERVGTEKRQAPSSKLQANADGQVPAPDTDG